MKKGKKALIVLGVALFVVIAVIVLVIILPQGHRIIKVESLSGAVALERDAFENDIFVDMNLKTEDKITTGENGLIGLLVDEDKHIAAVENTCFTIVSNGGEKQGTLKIQLQYGTSLIEIANKLPDGAAFEVETPNAALSVRGTVFEVTYIRETNTTILKVIEGTVQVDTNAESEMINAGEMAIISDSQIEVSELAGQIGNASGTTGLVANSPVAGISGQPVKMEEWIGLLKGGSDHNQLTYLLEVASRCEYEREDDYLKNALYWMGSKTYSESPYELIEDLGDQGVVYDVAELNALFSVLTDDTISNENLNPGINQLDGERLICTPAPGSVNRITSVGITYAYYGDEGEIVVEYVFNVFHTDTGETESFRKKAYLLQDETGKYVLDHLEDR